MSGANLLDLLGSAEMGQITIAEDELDDIDQDHDKKHIYKVGVDIHEVVPRTLDGNKSSRSSKYYLPFCYKIFAAEESSDSSKMGYKVTHNRILKCCRDIFKAKDDWTDSGNDKTRALRFDKEIILKVGSTFEVIPEIKILHKDDSDAKDDQTIWKDWDRSDNSEDIAREDLVEGKVDTTSNTNTAADNYNSLVSTAADISIPNKATLSEVVGKGAASTTMTPTDAASIPAAPTRADANNNLGATGQFFTHLEDIQASKSTKSEDHTKYRCIFYNL